MGVSSLNRPAHVFDCFTMLTAFAEGALGEYVDMEEVAKTALDTRYQLGVAPPTYPTHMILRVPWRSCKMKVFSDFEWRGMWFCVASRGDDANYDVYYGKRTGSENVIESLTQVRLGPIGLHKAVAMATHLERNLVVWVPEPKLNFRSNGLDVEVWVRQETKERFEEHFKNEAVVKVQGKNAAALKKAEANTAAVLKKAEAARRQSEKQAQTRRASLLSRRVKRYTDQLWKYVTVDCGATAIFLMYYFTGQWEDKADWSWHVLVWIQMTVTIIISLATLFFYCEYWREESSDAVKEQRLPQAVTLMVLSLVFDVGTQLAVMSMLRFLKLFEASPLAEGAEVVMSAYECYVKFTELVKLVEAPGKDEELEKGKTEPFLA